MVERSFDIGFGSVSVEDIADAKTFDALNTASLGGIKRQCNDCDDCRI